MKPKNSKEAEILIKLNMFRDSNLPDYKSEKREFISSHRYILSLFSDVTQNFIKLYYGIDSDYGYPISQIASIYNCTPSNVSSKINKFFNIISNPNYSIVLANYDDTDMDLKEGEIFNEEALEVLYQGEQMIHDLYFSDKEPDSAEQDKINKVFDALMDTDCGFIIQKYPFSNMSMQEYFNFASKFRGVKFGELLKNFSEKDAEKYKMWAAHVSINNLDFLYNYENVEDWENACKNGIAELGPDNYIENFDLLIADDSRFKIKIPLLDFTQRVKNIFRRNNVETIGDLVKYSRAELSRFRNMGETCLQDIESVLADLDLHLRPENMSVYTWIKELTGQPVLEKEENQGNVKEADEFDILLDTEIQYMPFNARIKNCLIRHGIDTMRDVLSHSANQYMCMRNFGSNSLSNLAEVLGNYGFTLDDLPTKGVDVEDWIERNLRDVYSQHVSQVNRLKAQEESQKEVQNIDNSDMETNQKLDIKELPEEYRKYFAMGMGESIKQDINNQPLYNTLTRRIMEKRQNVLEMQDEKSLPLVKVETHLNESFDTMDVVKEDFNNIYLLSTQFIYDNQTKLYEMIQNADNLSTLQKMKLIAYIYEPKINDKEM